MSTCGTEVMGKQQTLTWAQKHLILAKCRELGVQGGVKNIEEVRNWAASALKLHKPPAKTVRRILIDVDTVTACNYSIASGGKRKFNTKNNVLDEQLRHWVIAMWEKSLFLNDAVIQEKAHRLQTSYNLQVEESPRKHCTFSNGWLDSFKKRYGFKQHISW